MPLSKTCQSCADSKVRCVRDADSDTCSRCYRLGRECATRQTRRRFNGFQKDLRINALESKVNELMGSRDAMVPPTGTTGAFQAGVDAVDKDVVDRGFLTMEDAERFISTFKTGMTEHFPFVLIPPHVMAEQLRRERPFLFLATISSASYTDMPLQRKLGQEVKAAIATRMITNGEYAKFERSTEPTIVARCHYHTRPHRYTQFLQLAIALIIELRLDRPPLTKTWKTGIRFTSNYDPDDITYTRPSLGRDEQRAVAGCYYLSSTISGLLQKPSTFPHTAYLEECCKSLYDAAEYPSDKSILHIVQLQLIAEKIDRISLRHGMELANPGSAMELYVQSLKAELEAFRGRSGFSLDEASLIALQFHATELSLYQLTLLEKAGKQPKPTQTAVSDEMLCAGHIAAQSILKLYLSLPPHSETAFNNTEWVQIGFALIVTCRQTGTTSTTQMTPALVRHKESFSNILMQLKARVSELSTDLVDLNGDRDIFSNFADRVTRLQAWFDERLAKDPSLIEEPRTTDPSSPDEQRLADDSSVLHDFLPSDLFTSMVNDYHSMEESFTIDQMLNDWM
ncbi:hypothetical protein McanMca71_000869 [Microsporum canis]